MEVKLIWLADQSGGAQGSGFNASSDKPPGSTSAWMISIYDKQDT